MSQKLRTSARFKNLGPVAQSLLITAGLILAAPAAIAGADPSPAQLLSSRCQAVQLHLALGTGQPNDQTVSGTLCTPLWWSRSNHEVDVLMHGATYNRTYWDFPVNSPQYSYVLQTLLAGRATFAYDSVGAGQSSHPLSFQVTPGGVAFVAHQVVQWLRTQQGFPRVNLVGHSVGSMIAIVEAGTYHDVDEVIATGLIHNTSPGGVATSIADTYPAAFDPQFAASGLDTGYLTTKPGDRGPLFYSQIADPDVVAYDEAHKDVISGPELGAAIGTLEAPAAANISQGVTVPVLEQVGQLDSLFCVGAAISCNDPAAIQANEQTFFTHAPNVTTSIIPATGHDLTLHPTNILAFLAINQWIETH